MEGRRCLPQKSLKEVVKGRFLAFFLVWLQAVKSFHRELKNQCKGTTIKRNCNFFLILTKKKDLWN